MSFKSFIWLLILVLIIIMAERATVILEEDEQMIVARYTQPTVTPITTAGAHLIIPFLSKTYIYPNNLIEWHSNVAEMPTRDDKFIAIESFAYWKISDPLLFYEKVRTVPEADNRLSDLLDGSLRDEVARYTLAELIRSSNRRMDVTEIKDILKVPQSRTLFNVKGRRPVIIAGILKNATTTLDSLQLGIQLVDFELKSVNFIRVIE
ncbi:MAG TPA: SPFH domain-containing protein [Candidatus Marinimicrobia bacterium]|nr:SPFH domain-containing protein [Candidatus Neomarinimicrobiota bacterium]HRS51909.1 SPFH domain-containing protein [Candidatus Neomarinimicrobiota bacterium]HRU93303.1 SPFH domain-containing protein [Candidatus Neomarinimicrobiota bacterium]